MHPKERKADVIGQLPEERALFERLLGRRARRRRPHARSRTTTQLFTWWAPWRNMRQRNIGWRLDYVLASDALAATRDACPVLREVGTSDHAPVMATFDLL